LRDALFRLVEQLPEERLGPVLRMIRGDVGTERRMRAVAAIERVQERLRGVTGIDEELAGLRDGGRG